jgi:hypothetical protein
MNLEDLRNRHSGETIWVLGSGSSVNFLNPTFFDDKVVVAANFAARTFGCRADYVFSNYHADVLKMVKEQSIFVTLAKHYKTKQNYPEPKPDKVVLIEHDFYDPPGAQWNPLTTHRPAPGSLVFGSSSIHGAIHLAAHLGASTIVLVGADCGVIDGQINVAGYPEPTQHESFAVWNAHTILLKQWLRENYGVNVYSLNPFTNLNLEGHTFSGV